MKKQEGQTIIELLIATAVFSLIITPFLGSVLNLTSAQLRYRHRTQATQYAREGLEMTYNIAVNGEDWDDLASLADPDKTYRLTTSGNLALEEGSPQLLGGKFERIIILEQEDATLKVTSQVSWQERSQDQEVNLTTYLINLGVF